MHTCTQEEGSGSYGGGSGDEDEYYEDEYEEGEEGEGDWEPNLQREQHMERALMLQKAACLEMIGQDAYDQLYELLKSNQVRHVMRVIGTGLSRPI